MKLSTGMAYWNNESEHWLMDTYDLGAKSRLCIGVLFNAYERVGRYMMTPESEMAVEKAAQDVLYAVVQLGYTAFLLPVGSNLNKMLVWIKQYKPDVIINLCEGYRGCAQFESHMAALLEIEGLAFTGNPAMTLAICQDKIKTKILLRACGFSTPDFAVVDSADTDVPLPFPLIVKPHCEDASLGIYADSVVYDRKDLKRKISDVLCVYGKSVLVEEYIDGREFNVAVFDDSEPVALEVSEIDFSGLPLGVPSICSYEAKWMDSHPLFQHTVPQCPAPIDASLRDTLQFGAVKAFMAMECRDYARVDFRVSSDGTPYILEMNPNPDISLDAGYTRALMASGFQYMEFWDLMIQKALRRKEQYGQTHAEIRQKAAHQDPSRHRRVHS